MANFQISNVRIRIKQDTASNWTASSLIPLAGELCFDTTNNIIKVGDGSNNFSNLPNANIAPVVLSASAYNASTNPGGIDEEHGGIKVNGTDINVYTLNVASSSKLGGIKSSNTTNDISVNSSTGIATVNAINASTGNTDSSKVIKTDSSGLLSDSFLHTTDVIANDGVNDDLYFAFKVDSKGRIVEGLDETDVIASDKNTDTDTPANQYDSTLGLVQSDFNEYLTNNANTNKGKIKIDENGYMTVYRVDESDKFHTARTISVAAGDGTNGTTGRSDVTGSVSFDGSQNVSFELNLADQNGITITSPATFTRATVVNVNKQGLVVGIDTLVSADISNAINTTTGSTDAAKVIKTDASGELNNSFLKTVTRTDATADNTATNIITGITTDTKGRITATSKMNAISTYTGSTDSGKLVKVNSEGRIDASLINGESRSINTTGNFVAATGTYKTGVTYYTDSTGQTIVDTSTFEENVTDVSSYYVAQSATDIEVDTNSVVITTSENTVTNIEYSQSYVLNALNI